MEMEMMDMEMEKEMEIDKEDENPEWEEWTADEYEIQDDENVICLFCDSKFPSSNEVFSHLSISHSFDFKSIRIKNSFDFYDCIRAINYIRSEVQSFRCIHCRECFSSNETLLHHMTSSSHFQFPPLTSSPPISSNQSFLPWTHDSYLSPFLTEDPLLYSFEFSDKEEEDDNDSDNEEEKDGNEIDTIPKHLKFSNEEERMRAVEKFLGVSDTFNLLKLKTEEEVWMNDGQDKSLDINVSDDANSDLDSLRLENLRLKHEVSTLQSYLKGKEGESAISFSPLPSSSIPTVSPNEMPSSLLPPSSVKGEKKTVEAIEQNDNYHDDDGDDLLMLDNRSSKNGLMNVKSERKEDGKRRVSFGVVVKKEAEKVNSSYFKSYGGMGIHREMLSDKVRTVAYQKALLENPNLIRNAVVLDVGCGTGILSLFAAKAGASQVISVDASSDIVRVARNVVKANSHLFSSKIKVLEGMIENMHPLPSPSPSPSPSPPLLPNQPTNNHATVTEKDKQKVPDPSNATQPIDPNYKNGPANFQNSENDSVFPVGHHQVDVIVSEWMGYCLFFESMFDSVLFARDKWLKPGGALLPDISSMYIAGFGKGATSLPFWENVYGFDMSCVGKDMYANACHSAIVDVVPSDEIITNSYLLNSMDLMTVTYEDIDFTSNFYLELTESSFKNYANSARQNHATVETDTMDDKIMQCYGVTLWFDVSFSKRFCTQYPVLLSTSPFEPPTHWAQTILTFPEPITLTSSFALETYDDHVNGKLPSFEDRRLVESTGDMVLGDEGSRFRKLGEGSGSVMGTLGSESNPALGLSGRLSIVRSARHRSIDISLEITLVGKDNTVRKLPVQMFDI